MTLFHIKIVLYLYGIGLLRENHMRNRAEKNEVLNQTFLVCAEILKTNVLYNRNCEGIHRLCSKIPSLIVADYLQFGLELVDNAYSKEYIDTILYLEYEKINKAVMSNDELTVLCILYKTVSEIFVNKNWDFFYELYAHECPDYIRDQILSLLSSILDAYQPDRKSVV